MPSAAHTVTALQRTRHPRQRSRCSGRAQLRATRGVLHPRGTTACQTDRVRQRKWLVCGACTHALSCAALTASTSGTSTPRGAPSQRQSSGSLPRSRRSRCLGAGSKPADGSHYQTSRRRFSARPAAHSAPGAGALNVSAENGARASRSGCKVHLPRQRQCRALHDRSLRDAARMGLQHRCLAQKRAAHAAACAFGAPDRAAAVVLGRALAALSIASHSTLRSVHSTIILCCRPEERASRGKHSVHAASAAAVCAVTAAASVRRA